MLPGCTVTSPSTANNQYDQPHRKPKLGKGHRRRKDAAYCRAELSGVGVEVVHYVNYRIRRSRARKEPRDNTWNFRRLNGHNSQQQQMAAKENQTEGPYPFKDSYPGIRVVSGKKSRCKDDDGRGENHRIDETHHRRSTGQSPVYGLEEAPQGKGDDHISRHDDNPQRHFKREKGGIVPYVGGGCDGVTGNNELTVNDAEGDTRGDAHSQERYSGSKGSSSAPSREGCTSAGITGVCLHTNPPDDMVTQTGRVVINHRGCRNPPAVVSLTDLMDYAEIAPCDELKDIIRHFWLCSWDARTPHPGGHYYIVANTLTNITFAFSDSSADGELLHSMVEGHTYLPRHLTIRPYRHLLGVSVYSHALARLFPVAASEVSQELLSVDTLLARDGALLNERIAAAGSVAERIAMLTAFFRARLRAAGGSGTGRTFGTTTDDAAMADAVTVIRSGGGNVSLADLAARYGLSRKHLNRRFKACTGFTPKKYARVVRFESVIKGYPAASTLTDLAHGAGYFDQAHLNHEFRAFTGLSPRDFWKLGDDSI